MVKHILKQIWNLRGKNIWIILELFIVFVILWFVVDFFSVMRLNAMTPAGTDIRNVHRVVLGTYKTDNPRFVVYEEDSEEPGRNFLRIVERLRSHPDIESVCIGEWFYPYCFSNSYSSYLVDSLSVNCRILRVSPEYFSMFNIRPAFDNNPESLLKGFSGDNTAIISAKTNQRFFKEGNGTGKSLFAKGDSTGIYITNVIREMKEHEYTRPGSYIIFPFNESELLRKREDEIWNSVDICIKTKPGVSQIDFPERFREEMKQQLAVGNFFLADIRPLTKIRETYLLSYGITSTLKYRIGIGVFFLINIFLGVLGTFWLRIEKRRSEIGLRMSMGSDKRQVMTFMLTESLCMLVIASFPAMIVCLNLAYLDVLSTMYMDITAGRLLINTLLTYILLIVVIALSVWYPAKRSANIQPAEALHYE